MSVSSPVSIYYLASGPIGVPVLDALLRDERIHLAGVGTQPDRPAGRRRVPVATPVGAAGESRGLAVERIASVSDASFPGTLASLGIELLVVASFGQILRENVLELPRFGCLNVHASLLPRHRGASPIAAAILAGDEESGVCFMKMDRGLDTGPVYSCRRVAIQPDDTAGRLEDRLGEVAAAHIGDCIWGVCREGWTATPQPAQGVTVARRLTKEDARIDWHRPAPVIERMVRAYLPWPTAFTTVPVRGREMRVQITSAEVADAAGIAGAPGEVVASSPDFAVACGEGVLSVGRVVPAGRREMSADEFLRGSPVPVGVRLGPKE